MPVTFFIIVVFGFWVVKTVLNAKPEQNDAAIIKIINDVFFICVNVLAVTFLVLILIATNKATVSRQQSFLYWLIVMRYNARAKDFCLSKFKIDPVNYVF